MKLRFTNPDEFLTELRQSPPNGEPILRITVRHQLDRTTGAFRHLTVVASYLRLLEDKEKPLALIVSLESYQGEDWGPGFDTSHAARQRAEDLLARLNTTARESNLECRPGLYEL